MLFKFIEMFASSMKFETDFYLKFFILAAYV